MDASVSGANLRGRSAPAIEFFGSAPANARERFKTADRPRCRIYRPAQSVTQSGTGGTKHWVLEFEPNGRRWIEPLMGWTSSDDPYAQIKLNFPTAQSAVRHAERQGFDYRLTKPPPRRLRPKSYAETILGRPRAVPDIRRR